MATVLLAWELGAGAGHCVNLQPIAEGLHARGWDVWLAVRDLPAARSVFGQIPARYLQAPFLNGAPAKVFQPAYSFAHILHNVGFGEEQQLAALVAAWRNLIELVRPDVLVCEHAPTALFASRWYDVRRVVMGTGFFSPPDVTPLPDVRFWIPSAPEEQQQLERDESEILARANRLLEEGEIQPLVRLARLYADVDANFLLTFAELDHCPQRQGAKYWGMWSPVQAKHPVWPEGRGPQIFAYLKPLVPPQRLAELLVALANQGCPCLVYLVAADLNSWRQYETAQLRIVTEPLDIRAVANECDLAVLNGNAGTATELLLSGVPQLHIPIYLEQAVFSKLVEELGAGLTVYQDQPELFATGLATLLANDGYRGSAQKFAGRYREYNADEVKRQIVSRIAELSA